MRTLMTFFFAVLSITVGSSVEVKSQSIIISVDGINPEADTLNFGARTEKNPKVESIIVANNTSDTLYTKGDDGNWLNIISFDGGIEFGEFNIDQSLRTEFLILPQSRKIISVIFKLDTNNRGIPEYLPDRGVKKGLFILRLAKSSDTSKVLARDTLLIMGDRTARFMKPSDSVMSFDTTYFGTTKIDTLIVYNGTNSKTLDVNITQSNIANVKIDPSDLGIKSIPPNGTHRIPIEFTAQFLADTLKRDILSILSTPGANSLQESSSIDLKTFVAFQDFVIDSSRTKDEAGPLRDKIAPQSKRINLIEPVAIDSNSNRFNVVMTNYGNIQTNIDSIVITGDTNGFEFDFSKLNRNPAKFVSTSFSFIFKPVKQSGDWRATVSLYTDLRKRFPNLKSEDSIEIIRLNINGTALAGRPELTQLGDACDSIYISKKSLPGECTKSCTRTFLLKNNGKVDLIVNSISIANGTKEFYIEDNKIIIEPGKSRDITVQLIPGIQAKTFVDTLVIETNAGKIVEPLSFTSISTKANITIDSIFEANPGDTVTIPLIIDSEHITKSQNFSTDVFIPFEYRSSVEYLGFDFASTAAQKYIPDTKVTYTSSSTGASGNDYNVSITPRNTTDYFQRNPVLAKIKFKYYLSEHPFTEIDIRKFWIGIVADDQNKTVCPDFFEVTFPSKIIIKAKENSLCSDQETLKSLFGDIRSKAPYGFVAMMPMSGESVLEIQHFMPEPMYADISLYTVTGEKVETIFSGIAPKELTKFQHPLSHLTKGVYYCEMKTGTFRKTVPIIISQ